MDASPFLAFAVILFTRGVVVEFAGLWVFGQRRRAPARSGEIAFHSDPLVPVFKGLNLILGDSALDRQRAKYLESTQWC
jgi:hypothetical protein